MIGILLISHGDMARGMAQSATMFYGDHIEQLEPLSFRQDDNLNDFEAEIGRKIKQLDTGEGVIVLTDLFAGTPAHKTTAFLSENVKVICGMNFPMLLELLGLRTMEPTPDWEALMQVGRDGIRFWELPKNSPSDDDFY